MRRGRRRRSPLAASMASGLKANFGTMTKPFHVGHCGRNGLLAALMAEQGFEAQPRGASSTSRASSMSSTAPAATTPARIFADWATPLEDRSAGHRAEAVPVLRQHASRHHHDAAPGAGGGRRRPRTSRGSRSCRTRAGCRTPTTRSRRTPLEAKFSVQYGVVRALLSGRADASTISRARRRCEPEVAAPARGDDGGAASRHAGRWRRPMGRGGRSSP